MRTPFIAMRAASERQDEELDIDGPRAPVYPSGALLGKRRQARAGLLRRSFLALTNLVSLAVSALIVRGDFRG